MVAGLIGILRAGAAYLPLDPHFPRARLDQIVGDAQPSALLTEHSLFGALPMAGLPVVLADDTADAGAFAPVPIAGDDLAYVLYTSGSTGRPKGVEIEHRALINLLASMRDTPGFTAKDALLAVTTLSFDIAALELFLPLLSGGTLILVPGDVARDPARLAELVQTSQPSLMQATPATWRALIEAGWAGDAGLTILCGGEGLPRALADQLLQRSAALWNVYGPTETTIWSTLAQVAPEPGPVPIGHPIANTSAYVLGANGHPVPPGVIGELHIGGAGLARGYRHRPDLTAERFGEQPFAPGERLYRTGDLARQRADGALFCLGRTDNDEKIRGFRVAVEEIEGALSRHPAIAAAAVRSWPDPSGERALAAYLVARREDLPSTAALREQLAASLPDYMVPSRFIYLPALPMTPNAKVDRKALPEPADMAAPAELVPPANAAEERLAGLWREILGVAAIGRHDSFFDLGGHSLLVARLLRRVEADYGRTLSMADFFRAHRLDEMTRRLDEDRPVDTMGAVPIQPLGWRPPLLWLEAGPTFLPLAQQLGMDQPFLGVAVDQMLAREAGRENDFAAFARHTVEMIRAIRPRGPYYIAGWCTAGILAFEVAAQLRAAGEEVPLLLLAHAVNPTEFERIGPLRLRLSKLRFHLGQLLRQPAAERARYLRERVRGVIDDLGSTRLEDGLDVPNTLRAALDRAAYDYRPPAYDGDVALFQPEERAAVLDARPGWARVTRGTLSVYEIAGGHSTMLQLPHVRDLAAQMRTALLAAQDGAERGTRAAA